MLTWLSPCVQGVLGVHHSYAALFEVHTDGDSDEDLMAEANLWNILKGKTWGEGGGMWLIWRVVLECDWCLAWVDGTYHHVTTTSCSFTPLCDEVSFAVWHICNLPGFGWRGWEQSTNNICSTTSVAYSLYSVPFLSNILRIIFVVTVTDALVVVHVVVIVLVI